MSFDFDALVKFRDNLEAMKEDAPAIIEEMVIGEGVYAVKQARSIVTSDGIVDTGDYRRNWHTGNRAMPASNAAAEHDGSKPRKNGSTYQVDVYNNLDYAKHLEYGFRSHYVPAKYLSGKYLARFPKGLYVGPSGGYVTGRYTLKKAIKRTETTQVARLTRKWEHKVKEYTERGL